MAQMGLALVDLHDAATTASPLRAADLDRWRHGVIEADIRPGPRAGQEMSLCSC